MAERIVHLLQLTLVRNRVRVYHLLLESRKMALVRGHYRYIEYTQRLEVEVEKVHLQVGSAVAEVSNFRSMVGDEV